MCSDETLCSTDLDYVRQSDELLEGTQAVPVQKEWSKGGGGSGAAGAEKLFLQSKGENVKVETKSS